MNNKIPYDLSLVNSIYKSNNEILLKLAKRNLENNRIEQEEFIQELVRNDTQEYNSIRKKSTELANIDWIFLNSIFIALFTNFENQILKLAKIVEGKVSSPITLNDIKGNGYLDQYRKYMHLIGNIKSAEKNSIWDEIDLFKLVRNKLAHEGGFFSRNPNSKIESQNGFKYLLENKVILAGSFGHIRIREVYFLEKFVDVTNNISDELREEIEAIN